jgi:hypothetical protein
MVRVYVCSGGDCRKTGAAHRALGEALAQVEDPARVRAVSCQKICSGPVAGVEVDGRIEWFERIRGPKSRRALLRLVRTGGPVPGRLRKRRVRKRAGRLRGRPSGPAG